MLEAVIVDDEEFARSSLYFLLQENCPDVHITGIAKSVAEARTILSGTPVDLLFLDIAMPHENGFELLDHPAVANCAIIFTTAYDQYALKAIKASALDYLLKPIDIDELKEAVRKAEKMLLSTATKREVQHPDSHFDERGEIRKITLLAAHGYKLVDTDQIMNIEADSNYSVFTLQNNEKITVSKVLKDYEEILPPSKFMRIHKSTIVNFDYIQEYSSRNGLKVTLVNGDSFPVSRRRSAEFFEHLKQYTQIKGE